MKDWIIRKGVAIVAAPVLRHVVYTSAVLITASEINKGYQFVKGKVVDRVLRDRPAPVAGSGTPIDVEAVPAE